MLKQRCCHFGIPSATLAVHQPSSLPRLLEVIASPAATLLPATSQTERKRYFQAMGGNQSQEEQPQQQSLAQWMWQPDQGQQADHWEVPTIAPWPANPAMSWQATPGGVYMPGPPEVMDLTVFFTNDSPTWYKQVCSNQNCTSWIWIEKTKSKTHQACRLCGQPWVVSFATQGPTKCFGG